ncbi:high mobility group protein B2-like [Salarias fasciatus]|uniref:High mobility group protein B2 n=1 Tax=Salarias fasciatus TaxID=181472 RepID=A0A672HSE0_SALFA|nr:high mobility group protein B2-like [Salarias fasciatus]XP_029943416.1 high mobility group protein B2-like [Salarias fasciatus]
MAKDPNKPRGKISSYAFFIATCREEHKKKNPGTNVSFSEFSKKCAERWKTMSSKEKSKFEEMAKNDKVRYDREMKSYVPPKGAKKAKKKKDPNAPKRPPSAFFVFCSEFRPKVKEEYPGISIGDIAKKLGEKWSTLSAKDKGPYEAKAGKLKEKYEKDMAAYKSKSGSGKGDVKKSGPGRPSAKKQEVADDDDDDDDDDDEDEEDDDDDDEDDD